MTNSMYIGAVIIGSGVATLAYLWWKFANVEVNFEDETND